MIKVRKSDIPFIKIRSTKQIKITLPTGQGPGPFQGPTVNPRMYAHREEAGMGEAADEEEGRPNSRQIMH